MSDAHALLQLDLVSLGECLSAIVVHAEAIDPAVGQENKLPGNSELHVF